MCAVRPVSQAKSAYITSNERTGSVHDFKWAYMIPSERPALFWPIKNKAQWTLQGQCYVNNPVMFGRLLSQRGWQACLPTAKISLKKDLVPMTSSRPEIAHQRYESLFILGYFSRNQFWKEKIQFWRERFGEGRVFSLVFCISGEISSWSNLIILI